jgi:hypothetical protein
MGVYRGRRLPSNEFRVLQLDLARSYYDTIHGSLDVVTFDSNDQYATLSYVWDHRDLDGYIRLGGFTKRISRSLEKILRRLRASHICRVWIDQLCINQNDLQERNQQVARMQDTYSGGQECFVYLGEGTGIQGDLESLLEWISISLDEAAMETDSDHVSSSHRQGLKADLGGKGFRQIRSSQYYDARSNQTVTRTVYELPDKVMNNIQPWYRCIDYITSQRYWGRSWVVQELLASRRVTCLIGDGRVPWSVIRSLAFDIPITRSSEVNSAARRKLNIANIVGASDYRASQGSAWTKFNSEADSAKDLRAFDRFMNLLDTCTGQNLVSLLEAARPLKTSDPRDKIFALPEPIMR